MGVDVLRPSRLDDLAHLAASLRSTARSGPKTLTSTGLVTPVKSLIWSWISGTNSLFSSGTRASSSLAKPFEDRLHLPPLAGRLEAHEDVARVRLGGEKPGSAPVRRM